MLSYEITINDLIEELQISYTNILDLAPRPFQEKLISCTSFKTEEEHMSKRQELIDFVVDRIEICQEANDYQFSPRGYCPLCQRGADTAYDEGFIITEGLVRHLNGSHGARQCTIIKAVDKIAQYYINLQEGQNA